MIDYTEVYETPLKRKKRIEIYELDERFNTERTVVYKTDFRYDDIFIVELHDTIIRCLHEGQGDASVVANQMNISVRTLHRRLKDKNKVYRDVLKNIRKSMAIKYLSDHKLTLAEVALLLGYSDQSTFSRAFSTWYGKSPLRYKQLHL